MSYTIQISGITMGASILNVDLYNCTGDTLGNISGCTGSTMDNYTVMDGYTDIPKRNFPIYVTVPTGTHFIKVVCTNINDGGCNLNEIVPIKLQMPTTPTPTPTPTPTAVPTATPTNTPIPCSFDANVVYGLPTTATPTALPATATPTSTPLPATATPTNTPISFSAKYGLVTDGASAACSANNSLNITTNNGDFCSATYVYGVASLTSGLYFFVYNNQSINVNVTNLNNTGVVTSSGCESCPGSPATATPTPTPTNTTAPSAATSSPTPTPIPYQLTVFTGNSLSTACSNLINPSIEPVILFYQGSLGVNTILYRNNNYTNPVTPTVYCAADSSTVYVVGTPSDTDGQITEITSCPAATLEPTPIPEPTTYDVYQKCDLSNTFYYINYNENNSSILSINNFCCSTVMSNLSPETIATNYPTAIYFSNYVNAVCDCN